MVRRVAQPRIAVGAFERQDELHQEGTFFVELTDTLLAAQWHTKSELMATYVLNFVPMGFALLPPRPPVLVERAEFTRHGAEVP